jgi:hypothetical protein
MAFTHTCQLFFKIYIFTAYIVQKHFLKAMSGLLEAMRVLSEAVIVLLEAVRMFVKSVRAHVKAIRVLVEAVRVLVYCIACESASRGLETVAEACECLQGPL